MAHLQPRKAAQDARVAPDPGKHWIVVAEEKKAHLYKKTPAGVVRVPDADMCCSHPFPEAIAGDKDGFLHALAGWLNAAEREQAFDRLVLIAAPGVIAELRDMLPVNVGTRLCGARDSDVAKITDEEIEDHLTEVCWL